MLINNPQKIILQFEFNAKLAKKVAFSKKNISKLLNYKNVVTFSLKRDSNNEYSTFIYQFVYFDNKMYLANLKNYMCNGFGLFSY